MNNHKVVDEIIENAIYAWCGRTVWMIRDFAESIEKGVRRVAAKYALTGKVGVNLVGGDLVIETTSGWKFAY